MNLKHLGFLEMVRLNRQNLMPAYRVHNNLTLYMILGEAWSISINM